MKTLIIFSISLIGICNQIFADASYTKRKNCWGFISWRYKASANCSITSNAIPSGCLWYNADGFGNSTSCNNQLKVYKYGYQFCNSNISTRAWAKSDAGPNTNSSSTWIENGYSSKFSCGNIFLDLINLNFNKITNEEKDEIEMSPNGTYANIKSDDIIFNEINHSIDINNLEANLSISPELNSFATFKVFIFDVSNSISENDMDEILSYQAILFNGHLQIIGNLNNNLFQENFGNYNLKLNNLNIPIPSKYNLDDIIVKIGTDVGNMENGMNPDYSINKPLIKSKNTLDQMDDHSEFSFKILSNPASKTLNLYFINKTGENKTITYIIQSIDGKSVLKLENQVVLANPSEVNIDINSLSKGIYLIQVIDNSKNILTQKFIKQ